MSFYLEVIENGTNKPYFRITEDNENIIRLTNKSRKLRRKLEDIKKNNSLSNLKYEEKVELMIRIFKRLDVAIGKRLDGDNEKNLSQTLMNRILTRDNFICVFCKEDDRKKLHIHHIIPKSVNSLLFFDEHNLITVCHSCHKILHKRLDQTYNVINFERNKLIENGIRKLTGVTDNGYKY